MKPIEDIERQQAQFLPQSPLLSNETQKKTEERIGRVQSEISTLKN